MYGLRCPLARKISAFYFTRKVPTSISVSESVVKKELYIYCYGNSPHWTTKYRISSDPPLNACIDRLFGKMDVTCVSGGVRGCFIVCVVVVERELLLLPPHPGRGPAQSAERVWPKRGSEAKGRSFGGFENGEEPVARSERTKTS